MLDDLLQLGADLINKDQLYRALDLFVEHTLEAHLPRRGGEPFAGRGHSHDHRPDYKQICTALLDYRLETLTAFRSATECSKQRNRQANNSSRVCC